MELRDKGFFELPNPFHFPHCVLGNIQHTKTHNVTENHTHVKLNFLQFRRQCCCLFFFFKSNTEHNLSFIK